MGFYDKEDQGRNKKRRVNKFLSVKEGSPATIYVLDKKPTLRYTHFMRDSDGRLVGVRCLGFNRCPICQRNQRIDFNADHPNYISRSRRYRVNVLDITPVKRCPKCGAVYRASNAPAVCSVDGCSGNLTDAESEPLNEVKIFEKGPMWMEQIGALEDDVHPFTGEKMAVQEFPIKLSARGSGYDTVPIVIPQMPSDEVNPKEYLDQRFDLEAGLDLSADEVEFLMDGGSLSDILSARSAKERVEEENEEKDEKVPF